MVCPLNHLIPTGAFTAALTQEEKNIREINILFKDYYARIYKKYGITRDEMMILMPFVMHSDVLSGLDKYDYYGPSYDKQPVPKTNEKSLTKNGSGKYIDFITIDRVTLDRKLFNEKQQDKIDFNGLSRTYLTIKVKKIDDDYYDILKHLFKLQYKLDMVFLKPISDVCKYVSQKTPLTGNDKNIENATIVIEPLHGNLFNTIIPYTPINQSIKEGTIVNFNAETPFVIEKDDGIKSGRKFMWSNTLETIEEVPENPWLKCVHYGTIDVGSKVTGKFTVSKVDCDLQHSFSLFGFSRDDSKQVITLWIYDYYNVSLKELIEKIIKKNKEMQNNKLLDSYLNEIRDLLHLL